MLRDLEAIFGWILAASWQASVLAVLVLLLQATLGARLNPRWRYALWLLVLVRLLLPALPESAWSLFQFAPPPPASFVEPVTEPFFVATPLPAPKIDQTPIEPHYPFSAFSLLAILWLIGAIALLLLTWQVNRRFARQITDSPEIADPELLQLFATTKAELNISRSIRLIENSQVQSPAIMGLFRPTLLLPANVRDKFDNRELRFIFLHELAHLKRGDVIAQAVIALLQIVHWFNPVLWFAFRRMRIDREPATDALVLSRTGEAEKESYGLMLIKLLEHFNQRHSLPTLVGILEDKDQFKRRFSLIAKFTRGAYGWSLLGILLIAILALVCLTKSKTTTASTLKSEVALEITLVEIPKKDYVANSSPMDAAVKTGNLQYFIDRGDTTKKATVMVHSSKPGWWEMGVSRPTGNAFLGFRGDIILTDDRKLDTSWSISEESTEISAVPLVQVKRFFDTGWAPGGGGTHGCWLGETRGDIRQIAFGWDGSVTRSREPSRLAVFMKEIADKTSDVRSSTSTANPNEATIDTTSPAEKAVIEAVRKNDAQALQKLIDQGADPTKIQDHGQPLLFWVRSPEVAEILITHGASPNATDRNGDTALAWLCRGGGDYPAPIVRVLLKHGANPNATTGELLLTPLMNAKDGDTVDALIESGADLKAKNKNGDGVLSQTSFNLPSAFDALLRHGVPFDPAKDGPNLLLKAAWMNNDAMVKDLLNRGVDPNADGVWGASTSGKPDLMKPMQAAAMGGNLETVKLLLDHGAKVEDAMVTALLNRQAKLVKLFWDRGIRSISKLSYAVSQGAPIDDLKKLLDKGSPADPPEDKTFSPLDLAAQLGNMDAVQLLIARGADVNKGYLPNSKYPISMTTPLSMAASEGQDEIVAYLLSHGAKPSAAALYEAANNSTPYEGEQRTKNHFEKSVRLLLDAGVLKNATPEEQGYMVSASIGTRQGPLNLTVLKMVLDAGANPEAPAPFLAENGKKPNTIIGYLREQYQELKNDPKRASLADELKPALDLLEAADKNASPTSSNGLLAIQAGKDEPEPTSSGTMVRLVATVIQISDADYKAHQSEIEATRVKGADALANLHLKSFNQIASIPVVIKDGGKSSAEITRVLRFPKAFEKDAKGQLIESDIRSANLGTKLVLRPKVMGDAIDVQADIDLVSLAGWTPTKDLPPQPDIHQRRLTALMLIQSGHSLGLELPNGAQMEYRDPTLLYTADQPPSPTENPKALSRDFLFIKADLLAPSKNAAPLDTVAPASITTTGTVSSTTTAIPNGKTLQFAITIVEIDAKKYPVASDAMNEAVKKGDVHFFDNKPGVTVLLPGQVTLSEGKTGWYSIGKVQSYIGSVVENKDGKTGALAQANSVFFGLASDLDWSKGGDSLSASFQLTEAVGFKKKKLKAAIPDLPNPLLIPEFQVHTFKDEWKMEPDKTHGLWMSKDQTNGELKLFAKGGNPSIDELTKAKSPSRIAIFITPQTIAGDSNQVAPVTTNAELPASQPVIPATNPTSTGTMVRLAPKVFQISEDDYQAHQGEIDAAVQKGDVAALDGLKLKSLNRFVDPFMLVKSGEQGVVEAVRILRYPIAFGKDSNGNLASTDFKRGIVGTRFVSRPSATDTTISVKGYLNVTSLAGWTPTHDITSQPEFQERTLQLSESFQSGQTKGFQLPGGPQLERRDLALVFTADKIPSPTENPKTLARDFLFLTAELYTWDGKPMTSATPTTGTSADASKADTTPAPSATVYRAAIPDKAWNGWGASSPPNPQPIQPTLPPEKFELVARNGQDPRTFSGKVIVDGPLDGVEIGLVSLVGIHWIKTDTYQWEPVAADGSFSMTDTHYIDAPKALVVRGPNTPWTFLRYNFSPTEGAKNIVLKASPSKKVRLTSKGADMQPLAHVGYEIFPAYEQVNDQAKPLRRQRLGYTRNDSTTYDDVVLPLGEVALFVHAKGFADFYQIVDTRKSDSIDLVLMKAGRMKITVLDKDGKPLTAVHAEWINPAAPLSLNRGDTNADGVIAKDGLVPGTYTVSVSGFPTQIVKVEEDKEATLPLQQK